MTDKPPLRIDFPSQYISGYYRTITGEDFRYHSPIPYVERSLLVRSLDRERYIEWDTAPLPVGYDDERAIFVFMAGIDINDDVRLFDLYLNGERVLQFANPSSHEGSGLHWVGENGVTAEFKITEIDKYDDAMGFVFLSVPSGMLRPGAPVRLRVMGESAAERTWFMVFKEPMVPGVMVRNSPALLRRDSNNLQFVRVDVISLNGAGTLRLESPVEQQDIQLTLGHTYHELAVAEVEDETPLRLAFATGDFSTITEFRVQPVRQLDIYLIHHTHLDIGYTHHQDDVERIQWDNLESALQLGAASEDHPVDARFTWNPEGLWAVESYLESHTDEERSDLVDGIRKGWISLDGLYANLLTGIASSEGLMRALETSHRISKQTGVFIESAMLSDIPGFTWGLVPVLAQNGIKYLSIGPNFGHRIGYFSQRLGDRPFYWESPSGLERVLTWVSGAGYAWFHTGLSYSQLDNLLNPLNVLKYVDQLTDSGYPYDMVYLRYNIGSDNGPTDPSMSETVRLWNERYVSPRLRISNTADFFREFESRFGSQLPVHRGDLTGHWEDGVASTARETASVRRTAESLVQIQALAAILGVDVDDEAVYRAWRNVLLYYEHTWGSWNSISEPESEFTVAQWRRKKQFADSAGLMTQELKSRVFHGRENDGKEAQTVDVFNTLSWPRTDVVSLEASLSTVGELVVDGAGNLVPSQRLSTGELVFLASDVPAFGAARFEIVEGRAPSRGRPGSDHVISNGSLGLEIDQTHGGIKSLRHEELGWDFVNADSGGGLNEYLYVTSRHPESAVPAKPVSVRVVENGPLVWSLEVRSSAAGTVQGITNEIRTYYGIDRVDIVNRIDKALVYDPEAILYRFPFNITEPQVKIDVPWGAFTPEAQQLPGSSKNYMSVQRWIDIHNERVGITLVTGDVPVVQLGEIRTDATVAGWLDHLEPSATVFSYVMNNYWETNYRAAQEGLHEFHYSLRPHAGFDEADAERFAVAVGQPLIALPVDASTSLAKLPFTIEAAGTIATMLRRSWDGDGFVLRLYNAGSTVDVVRVTSGRMGDLVVRRTDVWGEVVGPAVDELVLAPYEIVTLRLAW